jgi:son of sevenless-like protein
MAVLTSSIHSGLHYGFPDSQTSRSNGRMGMGAAGTSAAVGMTSSAPYGAGNVGSTAGTSMNGVHFHQSQDQYRQFQAEDEIEAEEPFPALFCRALYDYESPDNSALSFRRGDIIEVLSQQPSGWWDGLLGDERGWFPSNYVVIISEEEADQVFTAAADEVANHNVGTVPPAAVGGTHTPQNGMLGVGAAASAELTPTSEFGRLQSPPPTEHGTDAEVDLSHALMRGGMGGHADDEQWMNGTDGTYGRSNGHVGSSLSLSSQSQSSDFWTPQVTPDNQVCQCN